MKATQQLRDEHEGIKVMLNILEQVCRRLEASGSLDQEHFEGILEFLKVFVDKCHHGKEEDLLFPALVAAGSPKEGPISAMLREHEIGRTYVKSMGEAFAEYMAGDTSASRNIVNKSDDYVVLLRAHIEKENNVLFVMADNHLSECKQDELFEGFEKIEEERIGLGRHEEFHRFLHKLSGIYLANTNTQR